MPLLSVQGLGYRLGEEWLFRNLQLNVEPGQIVGIRGDNGAGKTTLLNLIGGDLRLQEGAVTLRGIPMNRQSPWRRARMGVGRLYQGIESLHTMSALEIIRLSRARSSGPDVVDPNEWLDALGLVGNRGAPSGKLSWGSQRLLALAGLFAMRPCLFVLDEPAAGLSGSAMEKVSSQLREVCKAWGAGAVVVEHKPAFLQAAGARRFVLAERRLVEE
jgi:ABC-type branched-subunit amino acid transport system ATPase component